jgi:hypothetical protein
MLEGTVLGELISDWTTTLKTFSKVRSMSSKVRSESEAWVAAAVKRRGCGVSPTGVTIASGVGVAALSEIRDGSRSEKRVPGVSDRLSLEAVGEDELRATPVMSEPGCGAVIPRLGLTMWST